MSSKVEVSFKKLSEFAKKPHRASVGAAGFDWYATSIRMTEEYVEYGTGIAIQIPDGHVGLLFPRSSVSNLGWSLANSCGVVDQDFVGEVKFRFYDISSQSEDLPYKVGERVGQIVIIPIPAVAFIERALDGTERAEGGFGSTGSN